MKKGKTYYIGIDENNEQEGETFGHLFEYSDEAKDALEEFLELFYEKVSADEKWFEAPYRVIYGVSDYDIEIVNRFSTNSYKPRLKIYNIPKDGWRKWIENCRPMDLDELSEQFYKGPIWKK